MRAVRIVAVLLLAGAAGFAVTVMHLESSSDGSLWFHVLLNLWAVSPLAFLSLMTVLLGKRWPQLLTMLIGSTVLSGAGASCSLLTPSICISTLSQGLCYCSCLTGNGSAALS